jgi:hypothetical protein
MITTKELIEKEFDKIVNNIQASFKLTKRVALNEAWKVLQLIVASTVQIIETIGDDLTSANKKELAMNLISGFYDTTFIIIDIPFVPSFIESMIHKHVKSFLMILVGSTIDSMVTIFRNTGVFLKRNTQYRGL